MRHLPLVLAATVLLAVACGGPVTPSKARDDVIAEFNPILPDLKGTDMPWYGGQIERSSDTSMTVSYDDRLATVEQLREWWPAALVAAGWTETSRTLAGNGTLITNYDLVDGRHATMTIRPEGTLWWVVILLDS